MAQKIHQTRGTKTSYASDVSDEEWEFCAPYLCLMKEDAPQRDYSPRGIFNAVRYMVRAGCPWRMLPNDLPPWWTVHQQAQRWIRAGCFEALAHDLRKLLRLLTEKCHQPSAAIFDGRTMQSTPESGERAGYDGYKRRKGSKVHIAVDTLGNLLALKITAANEQERAQVADLVKDVQSVTGNNVEIAFVDQGYTGEQPAAQAAQQGIHLCVVKLEEAKRGFVLLPRRWVVERSFAWVSRFRRLARDYERLPTSLVLAVASAAGDESSVVREEPPGVAVAPERGRCDYVLDDTNGRPLAVLESKRGGIDPYTAKQQALPYAKRIGAPFIFLSDGQLIYFWDYQNDDARIVSSFYSQRDLERLVWLRKEAKPLATVPIPNYYIRDGENRQVRPYQQGCMKALDHSIELGKRRFLTELPTGTGKTDLICLAIKRLMQAGRAERVLFLVDRDQLAEQAIGERRIEILTAIIREKCSHVLLYGANIGAQTSPVSYVEAARAMVPERYPADTHPLTLGMVNSSFEDRSPEFWTIEAAQLRNMVAQQVRPRLKSGEVAHLSVFGLAPQPLLMFLGSLLSDIPAAEVFQLRREPRGWKWEGQPDVFRYNVTEPLKSEGTPALVFSLSATVKDDRIHEVLGTEAAIWRVGIDAPHNDFLKSRQQVKAFSDQMRGVMDRIQAAHGHRAVIHVFPAMPVALAVEFGRILMPKADLPLVVYDENKQLGGFVRALEINNHADAGGSGT